ncbi:MAG: hypothetical protein HY996_05085 [Micrococcales bacterium]|nr:hypothetical protein [Micrococcales bacterium]
MNDIDDQRLRGRIAAADPAAHLAALPGEARTALLERLADAASAGRMRVAWRRPGLRLGVALVASTAAVAIAAAVLVPRLAAPADRVLTLRSPAGAAMMSCLPLDQFAADALASSSVALAGTVTAVSDGSVQVQPDRFFRGGPADRVDLTTAKSTVSDATVFRAGERVLITAARGEVIGCGLSAQDSPELRAYYDRAFSG